MLTPIALEEFRRNLDELWMTLPGKLVEYARQRFEGNIVKMARESGYDVFVGVDDRDGGSTEFLAYSPAYFPEYWLQMVSVNGAIRKGPLRIPYELRKEGMETHRGYFDLCDTVDVVGRA